MVRTKNDSRIHIKYSKSSFPADTPKLFIGFPMRNPYIKSPYSIVQMYISEIGHSKWYFENVQFAKNK